jgi:hypothetical protein
MYLLPRVRHIDLDSLEPEDVLFIKQRLTYVQRTIDEFVELFTEGVQE